MLNKTAIAIGAALVLGAATSASADNGHRYSSAGGLNVFAQAQATERAYHNGISAPAVYLDGTIIGRDPDPHVRNQLLDAYPYLQSGY